MPSCMARTQNNCDLLSRSPLTDDNTRNLFHPESAGAECLSFVGTAEGMRFAWKMDGTLVVTGLGPARTNHIPV